MSVKILAIDTATDYGSVAITCDDEILQREIKAPRQHSVEILSMIDALLAEAGFKKTQLDAVSFGRGPGSFTGIRLATSIAQAIAFGLNIPIIPISTLQALAQRAWDEYQYDAVLVALDARLHQVYWGCYQRDTHTNMMLLWGDEQLESPQNIQWPKELSVVWKGIGNGWEHYKKHLKGEWIAGVYPKAYNIAAIARYEYQEGRILSALTVKPFYLRNQVAQIAS